MDTSETAPEDAQHWGRLQLSLEYDFSRQEVCGPGQAPRVCGFREGLGVRLVLGAGLTREGPRLSPLNSQIKVGLKQAADLRACGPGGTADPYARVSLPTQAGHSHETRVHRGTLCPAFQETCCFHVRWGWGGEGGRRLGEGCPAHTRVHRYHRKSWLGPRCGCRCWAPSASLPPSRWGSSACRWAPSTCSTSWSSGTSWARRAPRR